MARVYQTGFESQDTSAKDEFSQFPGASFSYDTSVKRTGSASLKGTTGASNAEVRTVTGLNVGAGVAFVAVRTDTLPTGSNEVVLWSLRNSVGAVLLSLNLGGPSHATIPGVFGVKIAAGTIPCVGTTTVAVNTDYLVEIRFVINATTGEAELRVNGSTEGGSQTGLNTGSSNVDSVWFEVSNQFPNGTILHWDDFALNDTSGAANNSWVTDAHLIDFILNGDGTLNSWTSDGASPHWDSADDWPGSADDDTTYLLGPNKTNQSGATGYFGLLTDSPADFNPDTIAAVFLRIRARKEQAGISQAADTAGLAVQVYRSDESTAIVTELDLGADLATSYATTYALLTGTGTHTKADWDGARIKLRQQYVAQQMADTTVRIRVTAVALSVDYAPPQTTPIAAADSLAVAVIETPAIANLIRALETAVALAVAEALGSTQVAMRASETPAVGLSESPALAVALRASETAALAVADAARVTLLLSATDTMAVGLADARNLVNALLASDSLPVGASETLQTLVVALTAPESAAVGLSETTLLAIVLAVLETFGVSASEAVTLGVQQSARDTFALVLAESARPSALIAVADTLPIGSAEVLRTLVVALTVAETVGLPVSELLGTLTVSTAVGDLPAVAIAEAVAAAVTLRADEAVSVQIGAESVTITMGALAVDVADSLGLTLDELVQLSVLAILTDTLALSVTDLAQVAVAVPALADSLACTIQEATTFFQAATVAVADTLGIGLTDAVPLAVQVALAATEALPAVITETVPTLVVLLAASDAAAVEVFDALATLGVTLQAGEPVVLTTAEALRIAVALTAVEVLVVQLVDGAPVIVEGAPTLPLPPVLGATLVSHLPAHAVATPAGAGFPHALAGGVDHTLTPVLVP